MKTGVYEHYKGGRYLVLGVAGSSDSRNDGELMVVYVCLYAEKPGPRMRVRSLKEFTEDVNGSPRFRFVGDSQ